MSKWETPRGRFLAQQTCRFGLIHLIRFGETHDPPFNTAQLPQLPHPPPAANNHQPTFFLNHSIPLTPASNPRKSSTTSLQNNQALHQLRSLPSSRKSETCDNSKARPRFSALTRRNQNPINLRTLIFERKRPLPSLRSLSLSPTALRIDNGTQNKKQHGSISQHNFRSSRESGIKRRKVRSLKRL